MCWHLYYKKIRFFRVGKRLSLTHHPFTHIFIKHSVLFIEHLLCTRHYGRGVRQLILIPKTALYTQGCFKEIMNEWMNEWMNTCFGKYVSLINIAQGFLNSFCNKTACAAFWNPNMAEISLTSCFGLNSYLTFELFSKCHSGFTCLWGIKTDFTLT